MTAASTIVATHLRAALGYSATTADCDEVLPSPLTGSSGATYSLNQLNCCCH